MFRKSKILSLLLCFSLLFEQSGFAQVAGALDISGHICAFRNSLIQDKFRPLHLRYLSYDNLNNNFKLLLDKGDAKGIKEDTLEQSTRVLLGYFFVGISLPNDSFWVNLRPDQEDNIIDPDLARTDAGKILLEADLQLKKDTAKFTSPETPEGKEYWAKLYQKAGEIFGSENITIPTLTRPWIVPGEIILREAGDNAYIYKATLKVCLEQDYLKSSSVYSFQDERLKELNEYSAQIIRQRILPRLTKEVNTARKYAALRQVYYSLILAQWFKQRFLGKGGLYSWLIDKNNLDGLASKDDWSKTTYFKEYQKSFKDGEYNIQEPVYTLAGKTVRSYFSGGIIAKIPIPAVPVKGGAATEISDGLTKVTAIFGNHDKSIPFVNPKALGLEIKGGTAEEAYSININKTGDAQVSHIKNLDRLLRIFNVLRKSEGMPQVSAGASDREIIEFCVNELRTQGLIEESVDESGNRIIKIKKEAESNRLAQAIREWAINPEGGVRAVNLQGADGVWIIVGFASELEDKNTLEHEQKEITYRKQGYSWIEAHNMAGGQIIDNESAKQYNAGRQDKIGAAVGREVLPKERALKQINEFNSAVRVGKYQQGAVVDLRGIPADKEVILVGDLHARLDNLKKALNQNGNLKKIQKGEAVLVILGDAVHSETNLREMDSSIEIMQFIMDLKIDNPDSVYYLLGNHDYLSGNFSKGFVVQGLVYRNKMEELYGKEFVMLYEDFIKASPLMVIGKGFVGVHGGPIKGVSLGQIQKVDVADESNSIVKQAEWGRCKDERAGYDENDVQKFLENMGQAGGLLIVGHSPHLISSGRFFARLFDKHYVIFAGYENAGYAVIQEGKINFVEVTQASPIMELGAKNRQREEVAISSKLTKYLEINYSESGVINIILAPNTGAEVKLAVFRYKDLPARFKEMGLNPDIEYFIVDEGSEKLSGGGFKGIRDGETVGIGRNNPGRFMLNPLISRDHISIKRKGNIIIVEDFNSTNGTEIRYTPFKGEVVPSGMGGTGFLPHIFDGIVKRLNQDQPLVLTPAEREVLLWGLLNPGRTEYPLVIAVLGSLDGAELSILQDMAKRWSRPEDDAEGKLQDAISRVSERAKLGISDAKMEIHPLTSILLSPKGKKMTLMVREIDPFIKTTIFRYSQMMNLVTLVLLPGSTLKEEDRKEIISLTRKNNVPLTIVQLEISEKGEKLNCVQFAFILYNIKKALGGREFPFVLQDNSGVKGRIIYSDLLNVDEINELQEDALAAKAILWQIGFQVLNPLSISVLAAHSPQIIEFLIEVIQEDGRIGNPNVLESLRHLKEIVLKGKAENLPSEKELEGIFEKNLDRLNSELDRSIKLIEQGSNLSQAQGPGGIDFRALPIVNQPVNTAMPELSAADLARLNNINIDSEWFQIQNMVNAGIIPSSQRIKEYMLACCLRKDSGSQISRVLGCIADILRIEEDRVLDTDAELKSILTLVESGRPESELQLGLSRIQISPQEPRFIAP